MNDLRNTTLGELAAKDYRYARIFKKYDLDFCCGGGQTIEQVCTKEGVDEAELIAEISSMLNDQKHEGPEFMKMDLSELVDHICDHHHVYVRENLPILLSFAKKVASVHGNANPEVVEVAEIFAALAEELMLHMHKEEFILFPYIKELALKGIAAERPPFGKASNPIAMMLHEHDSAGEATKRIRQLTGGFKPPEHACNTYKALYAGLKEFEEDLHKHIHLENNILFPKAIHLEAETL